MRITAEVSEIVVSCETPIQWEQFSFTTYSFWYLAQFIHIAVLMSLHGPARACIVVASVSPIHLLPIQRVLKHCGEHILYIIYVYTHILGHPSWWGSPTSWGMNNTV